MYISEIRKFVARHSPVPATVKVVPEEEVAPYAAMAFSLKKEIAIGKRYTRRCPHIRLKSLLLHEIGHIVCGIYSSNKITEATAHLWAINHARKKKMSKIQRTLEGYLDSYTWNEESGCYRKYILANRIVKRYLDEHAS